MCFPLFLAKCCTFSQEMGRKRQNGEIVSMEPSGIGYGPGLLQPTAFGRLKQEDGEFKANPGYIVILSLCTNKEGRQGMWANTESENVPQPQEARVFIPTAPTQRTLGSQS